MSISLLGFLFLLVSVGIIFFNHFRQDDLQDTLLSDIPPSQRELILATAQTQMPKGGEITTVKNPEGIHIRTIRWMPKHPPKGTILLCQGYSEFIEKYDEVVQQLLDRDLAVLTFDWRGQGLSSRLIKDPQKGHSTSFADFIKDAVLVDDQLMRSMPNPHYLMGHSMGGHLAFRLLQEYPKRFQKAILCAPFFGWSPNFGAGKMHPSLVVLIASFMKLLGYGQDYTFGASPPYPNKTLTGQTSDLIRFQKRVDFYKLEPHILMGGPTWNWILESTKSLQLILQKERIHAIQTPTLVASGAKDGMVNPQMHHQVAAQSESIKLVDFPDAMHEILMEREIIQEKFWKLFDEFMEA